MDNPIVWVSNEAGHPYDKIHEILDDVEIKSLSLGNINPLRVDRLSWDLARGIGKFTSARDYLLISGSPVVNALVLTMWLLLHPVCNLALWDAKKRRYQIVTVERDNLQRILQSQLER